MRIVARLPRTNVIQQELVTAANGMRFQETMRNVHGAAKDLCHDKCGCRRCKLHYSEAFNDVSWLGVMPKLPA